MSFEKLTALAFHKGPVHRANELIDEVRTRVREELGRSYNYEVVLAGRTWEYVRTEVGPRLALYLRSKKLAITRSPELFLSVFLEDTLYFVHSSDFYELLRITEGLPRESFDAIVRAWSETGRRTLGALPAAGSAGPPGGEDLPGLPSAPVGRDEPELRRRVGQLLVVGFDGHEPPPALLARVAAGEVGGVILFSRNFALHRGASEGREQGEIADPAQVAAVTRQLRQAAPPDEPLLVSVDQEGGRVQRLRAPLAAWPPMRQVAARGDVELTARVGRAIGRDLALLGFNVDYSPVLDVVAESTNTVIGDRSFGASAEVVAAHGLAMARGLLEGGVLPCGKHFPGHGGPVADSHVTLPVEERAAAALEASDLVPFARAVEADLPLLMSAHVLYPAHDADNPGTLSRAVCTTLLRERLGFRGVLISDDMEMGAIAGRLGPAEAALAALRAGVDCLLFCKRVDWQDAARDALVRAARDSAADRARIDEAAARVRRLKERIPPSIAAEPEEVEALVRAETHAGLLALL
jgi:beta-N-acetylhexosaminidase